MTDKITHTAARHLTPCERQALADLFGECDIPGFLHSVAGLVANNIDDFATADAAASLIRKAARMCQK